MSTDYDEPVEQPSDSGWHPVNVGQSRLISVNELVDMVAGIAGKTIHRQHDLTKAQGVRGRSSDNTLIKSLYNWEPQISLEVGMEKTYHWIHGQLVKTGRIPPQMVAEPK